MSRIALVDDDRNILTSVSMTLEAEGFGGNFTMMGKRLWMRSIANCRTWLCWTSRCPAWTAWTCYKGCAENDNACHLSNIQG